jgi:hypothetical protein
MKSGDGFVQGFNAQAAVEPELLLIVGQSVTEATNDKKQLKPMVELIEQQSGQRPEAILADNGYCSEENLAHLVCRRRSRRGRSARSRCRNRARSRSPVSLRRAWPVPACRAIHDGRCGRLRREFSGQCPFRRRVCATAACAGRTWRRGPQVHGAIREVECVGIAIKLFGHHRQCGPAPLSIASIGPLLSDLIANLIASPFFAAKA